MSAKCQKRTSLSQRVDAIRLWTIVEDSHEHVARFRCYIGAIGRDLAADAAGVFRNDLSERIALNGDSLSGLDVVVQLDQKLNEPATGREHSMSTVADKDACVFTGASHRPGDDPMMLEHIHRPFDK